MRGDGIYLYIDDDHIYNLGKMIHVELQCLLTKNNLFL